MIENKPLLSICIPTYNREKFLKQCLDSIVNQYGFNEKEIEIIISDNNSIDNTKILIKKYQKRYTNIHYYKNKSNIGFDKNLDNTIVKSIGKYCILLGDDDGFLDGSLVEIIKILKTNNLSFYISNGYGFDFSFTERITLSPSLNFKNKIYDFIKLNDFIKSIGKSPLQIIGYFSSMSGKIFLREKWINYNRRDIHIGNHFLHFFVLLHTMKNNNFGVIGKPIIKIRGDNLRNESFGINKILDVSKLTFKLIKWFNIEYNMKYSTLNLYKSFLLDYIKNSSIFYIKKYILKNSKQIYKIKKILSKIFFNKK